MAIQRLPVFLPQAACMPASRMPPCIGGALLLLAVLAGGAAAQVREGLPAADLREIEKLISAEMSRQGIPGMSVAVAVRGEFRWANGYGFSDIENYVPAKASTVYRLGSISKPVTAVAALQLAEDGRLNLDAPVRRYVPAFPEKRWPVTARQLLGHLGGIRHYNGSLAELNSTRHYTDLIEPLKIFANDPLEAEPGTRYIYSTYGYVLLGAVVEAASHSRFMDFLKQNVFQPAGMETIRQDHVYAIIPNRSRGYARSSSGELMNCSLADTSNKVPGGGLASAAEDLVRFALAIHHGKLLKQSSVEAMFRRQKLKDGSISRYGLGWNISQFEGRLEASHTGGQQGVSTVLVFLPAEGTAVAAMCNLEKSAVAPLARSILKVLLH